MIGFRSAGGEREGAPSPNQPAARKETVPRRLAVIALAGLPLLARPAAYDVDARTEAQIYAIPRATADAGRFTFLPVRRLVEVLDVAGFEVVPGEDSGLALSLRIDADFGLTAAEASALDGGRQAALQLLAGRLWWKGMAGGRVDVVLGRVTAQDPVALWAFDGASVTVRPAEFLALTAFGGLRVEGASWLASPAFAPDGVRPSDSRRLGLGVPEFPCTAVPERNCADPTLDDPAPTFGARLAVTKLPVGLASGAEVEYRRTLRAGGIIEERLAGGLSSVVGPVSLDGAAEWDLYLARATTIRGAVRFGLLHWLTLGAEARHWHPSFSADSIFDVYDTSPWTEARLSADVAPARWLRLRASGGLAWVEPTGFGEAAFSDRGGSSPEAALGATADAGGTVYTADLTWRGGVQGRAGFFTAGVRRVLDGWLGLDLRGTLSSVDDPVIPAYSGTFASAALLVSGRLERRAQLSLVLEDSASRFGRNDLRVHAFLSLGTSWDTRLR
jgi:hypothetical protein